MSFKSRTNISLITKIKLKFCLLKESLVSNQNLKIEILQVFILMIKIYLCFTILRRLNTNKKKIRVRFYEDRNKDLNLEKNK